MVTVTAAVGLLATSSACVTDRNPEPSTACADIAVLAESFPVGEVRPTSTGALVEPLAELVEGLSVRAGQTEAVAAARMLLAGERSASDVGAVADLEWVDAFDEVDAWGIATCGFSLRTLVLEGVDPDAAAALPPIAASPRDLDGVLDWADVLDRVRAAYPDRTWVDDGYAGDVGVEPGVSVVVRGAPERSAATRVCDDVLGALGDEPEVEVTVLSRGGFVLARGTDAGDCVPTSVA